jgi:predicted molibdopterin-dependent oxidoreductase YjgC
MAVMDAGVLFGPSGLWISGGYQQGWIDKYDAGQLASAEILVVQDLFASSLMERAAFQLPAAAFAERAGSFVNYADRLQSFSWAVRPPQGVLTEGQLLWRLLGRSGLYDPKAVLAEIAAIIPYFAPAAEGVPPIGVQLKATQNAPQPV